MSVVVETTIGDFTVDLFTEERPVACSNFLKLCKLKYYNYNLFHNIEHGFIAQTGDPGGTGTGGSSVWGILEGNHKRFFEAEYIPKIHHTTTGLVSLVGVGKHLVGSQFLITLGDNLTSLDEQHCVIGEVVEGQDVLRLLNEAIVDENFRPYQDIRITHTVILDDPFEDPQGFHEPSRSPSPSAERLQNGRIAADEDIDDTAGKSMEEIQEMLAEREAKARATILEIVGDLPDVDIAPPENVLFVCKLNPVTTDDDLEIIFSRFGPVKNCEVIRDNKTGDSLQYAFVEFEDKKACEAAYFKMDNVLIDDRRIHVDFSQSVSKVKWFGKGRFKGDAKNVDFNNLRDGQRRHRGDQRRRQEQRHPKETERNKYNDRENTRYRSISRERHRNDSNSRKISKKSHKEREEKYKTNERRDYRDRSRSLSETRNRYLRPEVKHRENDRRRSRDRSRDADRRHESHSRGKYKEEIYKSKNKQDQVKHERHKREDKHENVKEKHISNKKSSSQRRHKSINRNKKSSDSSSSDVSEESSKTSTSSSNYEDRRRKSKKKYESKSKAKKETIEDSRHHYDTKSHKKRR